MLGPEDLVLCSGTMLKATFREMIDAAVAGGFKAITLWPHDYQGARASGLSNADMRALLADNGLVVADLDPLLTWVPGQTLSEGPDGIRFASEDEFFAIADAVGARSLNMAHAFGDAIDLDEAVEAFAGVCDRAANHGLIVTLEFLPWSGIPDVASAYEIVRRADRPNATIMFDTWHYFRGARDVAQLRAIPGASIGSTQLNDAPSEPGSDLSNESMKERLLPGEGEIPLVELIRTLDQIGSRAPIGVEVFSEKLDALPPVEVGRRAAEATRKLLAQARS